MTLGRPPKGPELVDELEGSDQAKRKLRIILETISDEKTIPQACAELGIQRSRFHAMRKMFLLDAVNSLEPRNRGRPPAQVTPEQAHIDLLEKRVEALSYEVRGAQIREELAVVMPHVLKPPAPGTPGTGGSKGKGKGKSKGSKKKKARTSPEPTEPTPQTPIVNG